MTKYKYYSQQDDSVTNFQLDTLNNIANELAEANRLKVLEMKLHLNLEVSEEDLVDKA